MARSHRSLLLGSLLALIAAGAAFWWFAAQDDRHGAPVAATHGDRAAHEPATPARMELGTNAVPAPTERSAAPTDATVPAPAPAANTRHVRGTLVVTDARGAEHAACTGTMRFAVLVPREGATVLDVAEQDVSVTAGAWQADVPAAAASLSVNRADLDGRPARSGDDVESKAFEQPIALHARWLETLLVRVLADDSGADLGDVRVVQMNDWRLDNCPHPGNANVKNVLAHAKSPLQLPPSGSSDKERYWMQAPGYAWNQITLSTTEPGERVLRLKPGGDVDVTIVGPVPAGAVLRVREPDGHIPVAELVPARSGPTRVDALAEGTWSLALEKGDWFDSRLSLGTTTFAVTRGTIGTATITVRTGADVARPQSVEVRGTLRVSAKWGTDVSLDIEAGSALRAWSEDIPRIGLADMTKVDDGVYRWGPKSLLCGRYQVLVHGTEYRTLADVDAHTTEIEIVVPEPCNVRVRVLDATDDKPLANAELSWVGSLENWEGGWSNASTREVGDGWYEFRAPPGRIQLNAHPDGYVWVMSDQVVQRGDNELTLRIARVCGVEVTLKDGDAVLPFPDDAMVQLEHVVTKAGVAYWSGNKVAAKEPGEHVLTMQPLDGFLPIEARRVVIEPAKWTKVEILLQRKP